MCARSHLPQPSAEQSVGRPARQEQQQRCVSRYIRTITAASHRFLPWGQCRCKSASRRPPRARPCAAPHGRPVHVHAACGRTPQRAVSPASACRARAVQRHLPQPPFLCSSGLGPSVLRLGHSDRHGVVGHIAELAPVARPCRQHAYRRWPLACVPHDSPPASGPHCHCHRLDPGNVVHPLPSIARGCWQDTTHAVVVLSDGHLGMMHVVTPDCCKNRQTPPSSPRRPPLPAHGT